MKLYLTILLTAIISLSAAAQDQTPLRRRNFNHDNGVALKDWDPVSYFKGAPGPGDKKFTYIHQGIRYFFKSAENMEAFKKAPAKYEPAYGGWCAYSMSQGGKKEKVDQATYKIVNGKLYLFSNFNGNNTLLKWNENEKRSKEAADRFWSKI